jgi:ABC-type glycerol-3-phosphate transport system permease component
LQGETVSDQSFHALFALIALVPFYWVAIWVFVRERNKLLSNDGRSPLSLWSSNPKDTLDVVRALWVTKTGGQSPAALKISAFSARILFVVLSAGFVLFATGLSNYIFPVSAGRT